MRLVLAVVIILLPSSARANDPLGVGSIKDLEKVAGYVDRDQMVRVKGAKVAYVNYAALRRDFPSIRTWSNQRIERWVHGRFMD